MADNTNVQFIKCSATDWNGLSDKSKLNGAIVFVTSDTSNSGPNKIYVTDGTATPKCYALNSNVADVQHSGSDIVITYANGSSKNISLSLDETTQKAIDALKELMDDGELNLEVNYKPADKTFTTVEKIGGIGVGTTAEQLDGKSFSALFDMLLFPDVIPTQTTPPSLKFEYSGTKTITVGDALPAENKFNVTFDRGQWTAGSNTCYVYGAETAREIYYNTSGTALPEKATTPGDYNYYCKLSYADGDVPKNNKGVEQTDLQEKAGTKTSDAVKINATFPYYITTAASATTPVIQALIAWNATAGKMTKEFTLPGSNGTTSLQIIKVPRALTALKQEHPTIANTWIDIAKVGDGFTDWKHTTSEEDFNGIKQQYHIYTYSGDNRADVKLQINF